MSELAESWAILCLTLLVEWSIRWGVVLAGLAAWLTLRPPKSTGIRHLMCLAVLAAGLLLPVGPRWGLAVVPWPAKREPAVNATAAATPVVIKEPRDEVTAGSPDPAQPESNDHARVAGPRTDAAREWAVWHRFPVTFGPRSGWRLAALVTAGAWGAVALLLLLRLVGGWLTLARLKYEAINIGRESARLIEECRAALGLSRPVRIASHEAIASPIVVAGTPPVVFVPADWDDWPESHRRACLLHELSHLACYDDWTKLVQELLRIPFFFHPLVRWLLGRLDLERELLGDEAVVSLGSDPASYARLLFDLARRPSRLALVRTSVRRSLLPFLDHRTIRVRIERLLEDRMPRTFSRRSDRSTLLLGGVLITSALLLGGVRVQRSAMAGQAQPAIVTDALSLHGRLVDAAGSTVAGSTFLGIYEGRMLWPSLGPEITTDAHGEFRGDFLLPPVPNLSINPGDRVRLIIRLRDGSKHEIAFVFTKDRAVTIKLPIDAKPPTGVTGPRDVASGELAGRVVDADGKPIEGAEADVWTFFPGNEAKTDSEGFFRIPRLDKRDPDPNVEVVIRKAGYTPQFFLSRPTGRPGWVIVLRNHSYFEGRVVGSDGKPVPGALVRANSGPKQTAGELWTEATTDDHGHYRMYAQPDVYDFQVRAPGVGVARLPKTALDPDEVKSLDFRLDPGMTFRAKLIDSLSGEPVPDVRLRALWNQPGVEGRSDQDGMVTIPSMMPGRFEFGVETPDYARWWSAEAVSPSKRLDRPAGSDWQRNFDDMDFDLASGMRPVTITLERAVTITGRVVDPDGNPVAGASVDAALSGTGNSLTGDGRFAVRSDTTGVFKLVLPASGPHGYNLVAHDGQYLEWRRWANGVLPVIHTQPGEVLKDIEIRLSRPATVRGRVIDSKGRPVAKHEVRASAVDLLENRYFDPTVSTSDDGSYELKFVRPGKQRIQIAPFWLDPRQSPRGSSYELNLTPGESKKGVDFRLPERVETN